MKLLNLIIVILSLFISSCNQANRDEINDSNNLYISSLTPTHGSSVGKNPIISITFSEEIDSSTVDNSTIKIKNSTGTQIGGTPTTSDNKKINYSLNSNLDEDTYTITFSKNIKTESNKTIAKEYESNFIVSYTNDKWIQATSSAAWSARRAHASVVFNDKIWIIDIIRN